MTDRIAITDGSPEPLGVTLADVGVNVAVVSRNASAVWLCLFDGRGEKETARLPLRRDGDVWCGLVTGLAPGARYGLRADGPHDPAAGHLFDPEKLLVDPYAIALDRPFALTPELSAPRSSAVDTAPFVPKGILGGPPPAHRAMRRKPGIIYEVSVRAFTRQHPDVPTEMRGTVAALAHPRVLAHFARLGVDTVELMPLAAWIDERHLLPLALHNAWGYNPITFMAPDPRLAPGGMAEIASTVATLHAAGITVILDGVFNHTGESDLAGPTLSLRGLDNALYYRREPDGRLVNDTGTGNTIAADEPHVVRLISDAMRQWAATGIDGFRLDLAATLGRTAEGFEPQAPVIAAIAADPQLSRLTMIAEPWDVGPGGYQLGHFPHNWREWNDRYRDDVRRFWRGDPDTLGTLATRIAGSADIFDGRAPSASVNFIAAHDGFALADLVAYGEKHNADNGEDNRDGGNANFSWNDGVEGITSDRAIVAARKGDVRALLATLFVSRGTPMLTAGDEFGRTQGGNNNAYAQDNAITWLDWAHGDRDLIAFTARLIELRKAHPSLSADAFLTGRGEPLRDVVWLKAGGGEMDGEDWNDGRRVLGIALAAGDDRTVVWINGSDERTTVPLLPARPRKRWRLEINSADPAAAGGAASETGVNLPPRSVLVFAEVAEPPGLARKLLGFRHWN
ncbi:MAG TPA: glycogen debranching protein GlgX [Bauldia sp.]|nr:glycogen debranching protein GlgX [Bauldia sp.]